MKKILLSTVAAVALLGAPAFAADMPTKAPVYKAADPMFNWSGFYVGIHGGGAWGDPSGVYDNGGGPGPIDLSRLNDDTAIVGGQLGYNVQQGKFVFGIEVDGSKGLNTFKIITGPAGGTLENSSKLDWLYSARARFGLAMGERGNWLPFLTAGWGQTSHKFGVIGATGAGPSGTIRVDKSGFVGGAGIEVAFSPTASFRVEYLNFPGGTRFIGDGELNDADPGDFIRYRRVDVVRAALNFRFGDWGKGPVSAKY